MKKINPLYEPKHLKKLSYLLEKKRKEVQTPKTGILQKIKRVFK